MSNLCQILSQYVYQLKFMGISRIYNSCHVLLGISLVIVLRRLYNLFFDQKMIKALNLSDKYSYYVYLTHQIFILGSFSLLNVFGNPFVGCLTIVLCVVISAKLLEIVSEKVIPLINKTIDRL